ncbi:phage terminase large subunit family protein [Tritonibacter mobilis]|uniref:phage terminase large subunit family protein n=1 Tax=Tritonibacter mobilis TaxID=379347 RepID=UPI0039A68AB9
MNLEIHNYDGANEIAQAWASGMAPDPLMTVTEWADDRRYLSSKGAAEPGKYKSDRTPFLRAIMDALSPSHPAQKIVFPKSAQVGATEAGINWIGYVMDVAPGPFLAVQATEGTAKRFSKQRIDAMIEVTPTIQEIVAPAKSRDSGNTMLEKSFKGGHLIIAGGNSAAGLRSMPIRYVHLDEVDAYKEDLDEEGDPVTLAEVRTNTFGRRKKIFISSTPTIKGASRVEAEFELSDQNRYFVPCPHCLGMQHLKFERLKWEWGKPRTVRYQCEHCDEPIEERHKTWMFDPENGAEWLPTADEETIERAREAAIVGFHINGLYSPIGWLSWEDIARDWENAQGKEALLKAFKNTTLGESWEEKGEAPDWEKLYSRREKQWNLGIVPQGGLVLTMGVDVQRGSGGNGWLDCHVYAWGRNGESWLVHHKLIEGDIAQPAPWDRLEELCDETFTHESGMEMRIARVGVDTGDGVTVDLVYSWCRKMGRGQIYPLKGVKGFSSISPVDGPSYVDVTENGKKIKGGVALWKVAVSVFKLETYRYLRLIMPTDEELAEGSGYPNGYMHFPADAKAELFKQITAEQLVNRKNKKTGFSKSEWVKTRDRNEALDCRNYARAVAWLMGVDRWDEKRWEALEAQVNPTQEENPVAGDPSRPAARKQTAKKPAGWMGDHKGNWF